MFSCLLEIQLKEESNTKKDISRRGKDRPAQLAEKRVAIARNLYLTRAGLTKTAPSCEHWPGQLPERHLLCQLSGLLSEMPTALDRHDERGRRKSLVVGDGAIVREPEQITGQERLADGRHNGISQFGVRVSMSRHQDGLTRHVLILPRTDPSRQ